MRGDNVFIYQNIIIHYKYLHNNIRTFVEFLDQSIYAFFCPAPPRGFSPSPRPTPPRPADFCPRPAPPRWKKLRPAHPWSTWSQFIEERLSSCEICTKPFSSGHNLKMHITLGKGLTNADIEEVVTKCHQNHSFEDTYYVLHKLSHDGEKPKV